MPVEVASDLADAGHDVHTVADEALVGADDVRLMDAVRRESRVLLTLDKGIADIRRFPPHAYAGIVLLRPSSDGLETVRRFVQRFLAELTDPSLAGRLMIVSESGIRLR